MARKGHGRPVNLVDIGTYPDDGSSPCGSNEWNANRGTVGVMGFTKKTEAISSNNINITDSYVEVTNAGTIYTMAQVTTALSSTYYASDTSTKSFAEGDLLYLVKASGVGTVTLKHQNGGAGAGKITTLSEGDLLLDENIPRIFICRTIGANQEWIEYGGAPATTPTDITVADSTDTTCFPALFESATGDLAPKTDAGLTYNAGTGMLTATGLTGPLTGNASGSSGSCTGNSATVTTNANLTGDVTSSGNATTIASGAVELSMIANAAKTEALIVAASDNVTAFTVGTVFTFYMPYAMTLTDIKASVLTAPTGAELIVDVHDAGTTIMGTHKLDIDVSEFHTKDAGNQPVLSDTALANNAKIEIIIDQIGSSVAGAGLVVYLIGYQT